MPTLGNDVVVGTHAPKLTENAMRVLESRYLDRADGEITETPEQLFRRVAKCVASVDGSNNEAEIEDRFYELMTSGRFMPNSPTLMNAGRRLGMLSACFVLPVIDDIDGIFQAVKDTAKIQAAGGGVGYAFDELRPCGSYVKSSGGKSSGPLSFWRVFSEATSAIQQGSFRRGANMAMLRIDHPDIVKFLYAKQDLQQFNNFNVSVKVTDTWMNLVSSRPEAPFIARWENRAWYVPREISRRCHQAAEDGRSGISEPRELDVCYSLSDLIPVTDAPPPKDILAVGDIMQLIIKHAWTTGEPGLFFIDRIRETETLAKVGLIQATNPCVTGDTLVAVADGRGCVAISELAKTGQDVLVHCVDPKTGKAHVRTGRNPRKTREQVPVFKVTLDDGSFLRVTEDHKFLLRDGTKRKTKDLQPKDSLLRFSRYQQPDSATGNRYWYILQSRVTSKLQIQEHNMVCHFSHGSPKDGDIPHHINEDSLDNRPENLKWMSIAEHNKTHPQIHECTGEKNPRYGIPHTGYTKKLVGNKTSAKLKKRVNEQYNHKVVSVTPDGVEDVYNLTVDEFHTVGYVTNPDGRTSSHGYPSHCGIYTMQCGEEPLLPHESCNLGSINLGSYISPIYDEETGHGINNWLNNDKRNLLVDWDTMKDDIILAIRFLDNVVSVNKYPTQAIHDMCNANRKIGLGVMGFADALIRLGVKYDSEDGLYWANKFMQFINDEAIDASRQLSIERDVFPNFEKSTWVDKHPMRNACVTSIAPTGTISIIVNASGGIEPWFSFVFLRQILNGEKLLESQSDFRSIIDKFLIDKSVIEHMYEHGTLQDCDKVPDLVKNTFRTARDIAPEWHVKMQAAFQKHTTAAVSKTVNLPSSATEATIRDVYLQAHKEGCKGVTVYRDGARDNQPMALKKRAKQAAMPQSIFRRPRKLNLPLPSVRVQHKTTYGTLHLHVTLAKTADGRWRECEVFFDLGRSGDSAHPITATYGRLASMLLRLDGTMEMLVDQLHGHVAQQEKVNGQTGGGTSLPNEIAMGLLNYIKVVQPYRDDDGFLTRLPFNGHEVVSEEPSTPSSNGNGDRFIHTVERAAATAGHRLRSPCPTIGCAGELVHTEGCSKCFVCGEGAC